MSSTLPNPGDREPVERESRTAGRPGPGQAARRAVALRYERGGAGAPRVVAKGEAPVAERILALAEEHGVPIHSDPDLVELLSASEVGDEVPEEVYAAVARLLAFLWQLGGAPEHPPSDRAA